MQAMAPRPQTCTDVALAMLNAVVREKVVLVRFDAC